MNLLLQPWYLLLAVFGEWVRQEQEKVIEYLHTENQVLREKHGNQRILLNDNQRRRLAAKGKGLGRKTLQEFATVAEADTILRWHRQLVVQNRYTRPRGKAMGRPCTERAIVDLALRMARENVSWGYKRIQGALDNLGHRVCSSTIANILKAHGVEPAPERRRQLRWCVFLKAQWDVLSGVDLTTIFASAQRLLACLFEGDPSMDDSPCRKPHSESIGRFVTFGASQDSASHDAQMDNGSFDSPRPLCIRPPPSWSPSWPCDANLDNQVLGRRAA